MQRNLRSLFLALAVVLLGVGVLMAFSASMTSRPGNSGEIYVLKHIAFLAAAAISGWGASQVSPTAWKRMAPYLFLATVCLLVAVLVPGLGAKVNGARRWFRLGGLSFQPSELAKLTLPLYLATRLDAIRSQATTFRSDVIALLGPMGLAAVLVIGEPDLGTAALLIVTSGIVLWTGGWRLGRMAGAALLASPSLLGLLFLKPYQWARLTGFVDAWTAPDRAPYQIKQSLLTLGVGGWVGAGLGQGWQKLSYLPEANTDFVFAVIGEETGLIGTLAVIAAWVALYLVGLRLLESQRPGAFESTLGFTWLTMLVVQAALNIAVVTALVPPKGVSHPLISYGGTSLLMSVTILGAFFGITRPRSELAVMESDIDYCRQSSTQAIS